MSLLHWIWLSLILPPGSPKIDRALECFPDPEELFLAGNEGAAGIPGFDSSDLIRMQATSLDLAEKALERAETYGAGVMAKNDPDFPERLLQIPACPAVLYVLGDLSAARRPCVALVGTRSMSEYGRKAAESLGRGLGASGITVVSGMAKGIDTVSHKSCVEAGGKTIAVQGCGICNTYPPENRELKEIIAANGAVVSEFAPDAASQSSYFPIRNRIISGLSLGGCVVEAAARSGTSITANFALEQGRDVFAVPADVFRSTSKGTFRLLRQGAIPVSCAGDIIEEYRPLYGDLLRPESAHEASAKPYQPSEQLWQEPSREDGPRWREMPENLSDHARAVYSILSRTPLFADDISSMTGLPASETAASLTELELSGLVKPVSGRRFTLA
jgi:DNA processing protein